MKKDITLEDISHDMREGFGEVSERFEEVNERFGEINKRFGKVNERFEEVNQKLNKMWTVQEGMSKKVDVIYDKVEQTIGNEDQQRKINEEVEEELIVHDARLKYLEFHDVHGKKYQSKP